MDAKKAYDEIFQILELHKDKICFDIDRLKEESKNHLFLLNLRDYGYKFRKSYQWRGGHYNAICDEMAIGYFGKGFCSISWEDNDMVPDDEWLLKISFPTGAYIFGEDYPDEIFKQFFSELKTYGHKYIDSANKSLYFDLEIGALIFNDYRDILNKYRAVAKKNKKYRDIERMKAEIKKLEEA
jgi:hypothetical protein